MKPTIALFIHDPKCSVQSGNGIMKALGTHYNFKLFSKNVVEQGFFDSVDMIAVPGGFGDSDSYDNLLKHNEKEIRNYVHNGGKYLGICMGAYWAGRHYFDILEDVEPEQIPVAHMPRPLRLPGRANKIACSFMMDVLWWATNVDSELLPLMPMAIQWL